MALPDSAVAAIVRGVAAYMQVARPTDLPPALRPLKGKHLKMLTARRADIIAALDDPGFRALILDWLKDEPSLIARADATVLATVAQREQGWEGTLEAESTSPKRAPAAKDARESLERAKERVRKAKEETRRAKEDAGRDLAAARQDAASARAEVEELRTRIESLEKALASATKGLAAAQAEKDREVRKARKRAEKAEDALDEQKAKVRALRAEVTAAKTSAAKTSATPRTNRTRLSTSSVPTAPAEPQRRRRLPVPKGRFEDDPETLTEWLSEPSVHLLVDGYNVTKAEGGFGDLTLEKQRERLVQEVGKVARRHGITATVVFDGSDVPPGTSRRARGPVDVEYSRPDEIADDHLIAKLENLPKHPVVVATNDRELQRRAATLGATIATSNQFLRLIR